MPVDLADQISTLRYLQRLPDIVKISSQTKSKLEDVVQLYFRAGVGFGIDQIIPAASHISASDHYERLAVNRTIDNLFITHRRLMVQVLQSQAVKKADAKKDIWDVWSTANEDVLDRLHQALKDLLQDKNFGLAQLAVANSLLDELVIIQ